MSRLLRSTGPFIALLFGLAGCDLPQGAGMQSQILAGSESPEATFAVRFVTRETLPVLKSWPFYSGSKGVGWISNTAGPAGRLIEAGDLISLTVWDNEEGSLLNSPGQKLVALPDLTVSPKGTVFIPYADEVYIAKMSPDQARLAIQEKLIRSIPSVQVQLGHESGRRNAIDIVSGVGKPGSYPLPDRNFTILSAVALGGGVAEIISTPQVRLLRDGKLYGISMDRLLQNPGLDTTLRGGDKVFVESEDRYFLSLGAAGKEAQVIFPQDHLTALDAMSLIGGVNDGRGNPKGILVLRDYPAAALRPDDSGPERERMVFAIDLTTADGLFSAGDFAVQHRDLVLVTESPVTTTQTIFGLVGAALGLGERARAF